MSRTQIVVHLLALWATAGFLYRKSSHWKDKETLFEHQDWSIWITPLFVTVIDLGMAMMRLLSALYGDSLPVVYSMVAQIFLFIGVFLFYQRFLKLPYTMLGLYLNQLSFRLIFGLRWIVGYFFIFYGVLAYFFISVVSQEKYDQLLLGIDFQGRNIITRYLKFFEETWGVHSLWIPIFFIIVFRPVSEEIIYRGLLYGPIRKRVGPLLGIFMALLQIEWVNLSL